MRLFISVLWYVIAAGTVVYTQNVSIPGGSFSMGAASTEEDESPVHTVTLSSFRIDVAEVSSAMYDTCVEKGKCTPAHYSDGACYMWTSTGIHRVIVPREYRSGGYPVVCVTWSQAQQYCAFKGGRLPTEAEWEYAAVAGTKNVFAWGNQKPDRSRCAQSSNSKPDLCKSHPANAWGLYDMTGNVWEWTGDYYTKDYYSVSEPKNPRGSPVGRFRVIRGGGWYSTVEKLRVRNRQWFAPEVGEVSVGFRCVK
jgi:formylglycine-generating enzyme required for sulfatase activity